MSLANGAPVFRLRFTALEGGVKRGKLPGFDEKAMTKIAYTTALAPAVLQTHDAGRHADAQDDASEIVSRQAALFEVEVATVSTPLQLRVL